MNNGATIKINVDEAILSALREDVTSEDISTNAVMREPRQGRAELICKQDGVMAGIGVFRRVFELLDDTAAFELYYEDGDKVSEGTVIGVVTGDIRCLLTGERTALNFLQRMSGIATYT